MILNFVLDTERTNATYESNDFEPETELEPKSSEKVIEVEDEKVESVTQVKEIGAGDANILTVNIPSGKPQTDDEDAESGADSDFTDVSPMITPRPVVAEPVIIEEPVNEIELATVAVTEVKYEIFNFGLHFVLT